MSPEHCVLVTRALHRQYTFAAHAFHVHRTCNTHASRIPRSPHMLYTCMTQALRARRLQHTCSAGARRGCMRGAWQGQCARPSPGLHGHTRAFQGNCRGFDPPRGSLGRSLALVSILLGTDPISPNIFLKCRTNCRINTRTCFGPVRNRGVSHPALTTLASASERRAG